MAVIGLLLGACAKAPALPEQSTAALSENKVSNNELVSKEKETNKGEITAWVILKERASLAQASAIRDWKVRGTAVHQALVDAADRHQANLRAWLEKKGVSYKSFWIVNTIRVTATQAVLDEIAKRPDVAQIEDDKVFPLPPMLPAAPVVPVLGTEWGINSIRAPEAWSAFNAFGDGIVVANVDTGVQYDHPALVNQYRGKQANGTFNHNYNWYDPSNICGSPSLAPCDNNNHGTHTMGTMVGDDGSPGTNRIGVAPHAKWMAAKGCETNGCSSTALLSAGQWILAPTDLTGANPRPDLRPNVVNNSWGGGGGNTWYQQIVQNWVAAGIFPAFSNGNMGSSCNSSGTPGDYPESFSAGAYDVSNVIASFSSRGPSVFGIIKPNIAAPGVSVRSSIAGGGYDSFSGTSMASPHVAGSVALIWSAAPSLVGDIAATKALLAQTAVDTSDITCGGTAANNNVWGEGKLDVYAAIDQAPRGPTGTLQGTVTSAATSAPLSGVTITISGSTRSATTNSTGQYQLTLPVGTYAVTATLYGYQSGSANPVTITQGTTTTQDFALAAVPSHSISGTVLDDLQAPVANAKVTVVGTPLAPATTATDGSYSFAAVPDGEYDVSVEGSGCLNGQTIHVVLTANTTASFTLTTRKDSFGYACRPATYAFVDATNVLDLTGDDASTSVTLPFSFPFYGQAYTTAYVSTNGFVNLLALDNSFSNTSIPNASTPNAAIYPFWDDLYVDATNGSVLTELVGTAPNRRFVIEWRSVRFFGNSGAPYLRFELALSENGTITFQYATVGSDGRAQGNSATVGVENSLGTAALQYGYNQVMVSDGQAISFVPPSDAPPVNMPPTVNAGNDQTITLPATASLTGAATDDGLPNPPAAITTTWSKVSGPGTVTFGNASALSTTATFSAAGVYTLRLTASDSALSSTDDVVITVNPTSPVNTPPVVNAGPDQAITLPATASLSGTVTDDGLPNPPAAVTTTWSKVSGPGTVTFANASAQATTATFSAAGSYMLRLTASDSALSSSDDIVVTVNPTQPVNTPPVVNAGPDQAITLPASASLSGTVTDDGLPNPPAAVTTTWSKVSGPGTVTFANASARATTATFSAAGSYTLRLTASDSALSSSDDIVVTVNAGPTTPCGGLCNNPTVFTINGSFQSGNLGTGAVCYQTTSNVVGGNCGNLQSPRTLTVNGTTMTCNGGNWSSIPARRNGGYCVQTTAGNYPWAYFTAW
jgi:subtilisin family serine protease